MKAIHHTLRFIALPLTLTTASFAQTPPAPAAPPEEPAPAAPAEATEAPAAAPAETPPAEPAPALPVAAEAPAEAPAAEAAPPAVEVKAAEAAAAVTADVPEAPPTLGPFTFGTSTWSRFEVREGYDRLGVSPPAIVNPARTRFTEGDQTVFRARLSMASADLPLGPNLTGMVQFTPQASGSWGTSGLGGTIGEANLGIYEGYFKFKGERFELKGGRFAMNYGDALVIGNLDWHQSGRAFDGVHAKYKMNKGYVDAFATQTGSGFGAVTDPFFAGDTYFWGLYSGWGGYIKEGLDLDLYLLGLSVASTENFAGTDTATGAAFTYQRDGATLMTAGARVKQKLGVIDYRIEGDLQFGQTVTTSTNAAATQALARSTLAYQAEAELGFAFSKKVRLGIGGNIASGDDDPAAGGQNEAYNELFPTTHKWLGLMDVIGTRTNVASGYFKLSAGLTETFTLMLDGHLFARPSAGGLGRSATSTSGLAGGELNAQLAKKFGKWGSLRGLYGVFLANGDHYATDEAAHYVEIQGGIDF